MIPSTCTNPDCDATPAWEVVVHYDRGDVVTHLCTDHSEPKQDVLTRKRPILSPGGSPISSEVELLPDIEVNVEHDLSHSLGTNTRNFRVEIPEEWAEMDTVYVDETFAEQIREETGFDPETCSFQTNGPDVRVAPRLG